MSKANAEHTNVQKGVLIIEDSSHNQTDLELIQELNARLEATSKVAKELAEEKQALQGEVLSYTELMEEAVATIEANENEIGALRQDRENVREEVMADRISHEIQEALTYKKRIIKEADEEGKAIIEKAQLEAQDKASVIIAEAKRVLEYHNDLADKSVELHANTVAKLKLLAANIARSLGEDIDFKEHHAINEAHKPVIREAEVEDIVDVKAAEVAETVEDKSAKIEDDIVIGVPEFVKAAGETHVPETKSVDDEKPNGWSGVKPSNERAAKAAERLRSRKASKR